MKIAIAQLNPTIGDLTNNAKQILTAARQAAKQGVRRLLTPELSLCGYPPRDLLLYPGFVEAIREQLEDIARQLPTGVAALVGAVEANPSATSKGQKPLFNSMALLDRGKVQHIFHKRLLPSYDVFDEDRYFQPGYETNYFSLKTSFDKTEKLEDEETEENDPLAFNIGVTICEDLWNDEQFWGKRHYEVNPIEDLAYLGVDLVVNLSASPYSVGKQKLREAILYHATTRYQLPIIYVNQVGANDDLIFDGNSVVVNKRGKIVYRAKSFKPDLVVVELDRVKREIRSSVTTFNPGIADENEEIFAALVLGVKDYASKSGFDRVVLGLSGGIDSSLVAAIATEAMGADNVLGVLMPSPYSSDHSIADAVALVNNLGIKSQQIPIESAMSAYDRLLEPLFSGTEFGVTEENLQSRIRGNLLMAIANKFGYLLLSTGNKSEMAVGYCTLYGDMNGGLAVIADVPKTRVYSICHWLNRERFAPGEAQGDREIIPKNVISKPPSAELKPGQVDQDSLPLYEILDDILNRLICQHQSEPEIVQSGHDREVVKKVIKLVARAEFKRRQAPPGLKITDRAFGTGWRMPIASRWLAD